MKNLSDKQEILLQELSTKYSVIPEIISYIRSCHWNIKLTQNQMIDRQNQKISEIQSHINKYKKKIKQREFYLEQYPNQKELHQSKIKNALQEIKFALNGENKRVAIRNFLINLSSNDFQNVIQPL